MSRGLRTLAVAALALSGLSASAQAEDLVVYGAGSLREAIGQIAADFAHAHGLTIATQFGPSGRMRERIEKGERVDLFTSADVGHARKLVEDGRASVMGICQRSRQIWRPEMQGEVCLCGYENDERGCGTTKVKQTAAASGDMLVMAGTEAEGVTDFIIAATEALRRGEALEAAHTSDAAFDAAMILLQSMALVHGSEGF